MPDKQLQKANKVSAALGPALHNRRRFILKKILNRYMGLPFTQLQPQLTVEDIVEAGLEDALQQVLKQLMPRNGKSKLQTDPIEIEVKGVAIALDEEISFSHYRYQTLQSPVYTIPLVQDLKRYQEYCQYWGELIGEEESSAITKLLRQRAIKDYLQDLLPVVHHTPLIRLSVYDRFGTQQKNRSLHEILAEEDEPYYLYIADYIVAELDKMEEKFYLAS